MKKEELTEDNLRKLFDLQVKRFPEPYDFTIDIITDLAEAQTPEEREQISVMSETPSYLPSIYPKAFMIRNKYQKRIDLILDGRGNVKTLNLEK